MYHDIFLCIETLEIYYLVISDFREWHKLTIDGVTLSKAIYCWEDDGLDMVTSPCHHSRITQPLRTNRYDLSVSLYLCLSISLFLFLSFTHSLFISLSLSDRTILNRGLFWLQMHSIWSEQSGRN